MSILNLSGNLNGASVPVSTTIASYQRQANFVNVNPAQVGIGIGNILLNNITIPIASFSTDELALITAADTAIAAAAARIAGQTATTINA